MRENDGGPVHPVRIPTGGVHAVDEPAPSELHTGISLRDYFAAHADERAWLQHHYESDGISSVAWRYRYADAMLAEREKPHNEQLPMAVREDGSPV